jgi:hypothetical protein
MLPVIPQYWKFTEEGSAYLQSTCLCSSGIFPFSRCHWNGGEQASLYRGQESTIPRMSEDNPKRSRPRYPNVCISEIIALSLTHYHLLIITYCMLSTTGDVIGKVQMDRLANAIQLWLRSRSTIQNHNY